MVLLSVLAFISVVLLTRQDFLRFLLEFFGYLWRDDALVIFLLVCSKFLIRSLHLLMLRLLNERHLDR